MGKKALDPVEMNKTISIIECRNLRDMFDILTNSCMLTKMEYLKILLVINEVLIRMELEDGAK